LGTRAGEAKERAAWGVIEKQCEVSSAVPEKFSARRREIRG
jgi:hypothetical protein